MQQSPELPAALLGTSTQNAPVRQDAGDVAWFPWQCDQAAAEHAGASRNCRWSLARGWVDSSWAKGYGQKGSYYY